MISRHYQSNTNRGISSVISVILMIALTIVLVSLVGTYAFNLAESVLQQPAQAAVSFDKSYSTFNDVYVVNVILTSAPNADHVVLRGDYIQDGDSEWSNCQDALNQKNESYSKTVSRIGNSATVCVSGDTGGSIRAVAITDNSKQVVQTYTIQPRN